MLSSVDAEIKKKELADAFRQSTDLRSFEIVTNDKTSIYVNLPYLAEMSEYFKCLFSGSFTEKSKQQVEMIDIFAEHLIEFLSFVCPHQFSFERNVTSDNLYVLLYFSDRLMFPSIQHDVKAWILSDTFKRSSFATDNLVEIAILMRTQNYTKSEMEPIFKKLAYVNEAEILKCLETADKNDKEYVLDKVRFYRPYDISKFQGKSYYDWPDYRARMFF